MNANQLVQYYLQHMKTQFWGEIPQRKFLQVFKQHVEAPVISDDETLIAIDVGANKGDFVREFHAIYKVPPTQYTTYLFEPNPVNLQHLIKHYTTENIIVSSQAISDVDESSAFYNWVGAHTNVLGNGNAGLRSGGQKIADIQVVRLDSFFSSINLDIQGLNIFFLKVDTEGNDTKVIKGLGKYISSVKYILFECSDCLDDHRGPGIAQPMKDIVEFLDQRGFNVYRIGTHKLIQVNGEYWHDDYEKKTWSDCFAMKKQDPLIHKLINENFDYRC
jgi:FkbM family methyltransferase